MDAGHRGSGWMTRIVGSPPPDSPTLRRDHAPFALALGILLLLPAAGHAQFDPGALERLLEAGRAEAAYELALEDRDEFEGELMFDLYYGVAALDSGRLSEGVFALERVVMQRPGFARARLELARGYFMMGEDRRAQEHFEAVLAQEPPAPVRATIERYQQAMRQRADRYSAVITGHVEIGGGYDSNVNSATDEDTIDTIIGFPILLDEDSRELSDSFGRAAAHARISLPGSPTSTGFGAVDFEERFHADEGDFNTRRLQARVGTVLHGETLQTEMAARVQRFWLDGESYQKLNGIDVNTRYLLSPALALQGGVQWSQMRYDDQSHRDSTLWLLFGGATRVWQHAWRPVASGSLFLGEEQARLRTQAAKAGAERGIAGLNGLFRLQPAPQWSVTTRAQYRHSNYAEENALLGETRREDYYHVELDVQWQPTANWRVGPRVSYSRNSANTDLHDYEREVFELTARYSFF